MINVDSDKIKTFMYRIVDLADEMEISSREMKITIDALNSMSIRALIKDIIKDQKEEGS